MEILRKVNGVQNFPVPIGGPPFIHDFSLDLGNKVLGLLVNNGENILLPFRQPRILIADEKKQVILGFKRNFVEIRLLVLFSRVNALEWVVRGTSRVNETFPLFLARLRAQQQVSLALKRDRMRRVNYLLHTFNTD